ncbi:MAG: hypothetical protein P9M00_00025 [Candidatus Tritonobacter lacicola]|nr:hypothetical protein [Candidatus Tritonobacter lacicola]
MDKVNILVKIIKSIYAMIIFEITIDGCLGMFAFSGHVSRVFFLKDDFSDDRIFMGHRGTHVM